MITYLIDTSAYVDLATDPAIRRRWDAEVETGAIGICEPTRAEVLFSATSAEHREELEGDLDILFAPVRVPKDAWKWVDSAQYKLTLKGQHRGPGPLDLLLCATAVHHGLIVLHRDNDYATVARLLPELEELDVRRRPST